MFWSPFRVHLIWVSIRPTDQPTLALYLSVCLPVSLPLHCLSPAGRLAPANAFCQMWGNDLIKNARDSFPWCRCGMCQRYSWKKKEEFLCVCYFHIYFVVRTAIHYWRRLESHLMPQNLHHAVDEMLLCDPSLSVRFLPAPSQIGVRKGDRKRGGGGAGEQKRKNEQQKWLLLPPFQFPFMLVVCKYFKSWTDTRITSTNNIHLWHIFWARTQAGYHLLTYRRSAVVGAIVA